MNLNRGYMSIFVVRDGAELELVVKMLVAVRTLGVAETVRCAAGVRLMRTAGAEV
jgi:hypothetical protein